MSAHCYGRLYHQLSLLAGHGMFPADEDIVDEHLHDNIVVLTSDPMTLHAASLHASSPSAFIVTPLLEPLQTHVIQYPGMTWSPMLIKEGQPPSTILQDTTNCSVTAHRPRRPPCLDSGAKEGS
jgi:hypothetical protein